MPLEYDPQREEHSNNKAHLRIAANPYTDTLSLPFFDDFTSTNASIDSIYFLSDGTLEITTLGHHGLRNQEKISFTFTESEASYLNGNYFIKNTGKSSFIIFNDAALTIPKLYTSIPAIRYHGYWRRPGAKIGPNPDFTKWIDSGGTYINNTLCINPPSKFVASFDGLNAKGNPYSGSSARGLIDNLTSLPIDLSGLGPKDSVSMSFFWQAQGNGFLPKFSDSLYLVLKDSTGLWNYAWSIRRRNNSIDSSLFYKALVKILKPIYFYNGFQFRFQAVGNTGAAGDNWNLDYIYLDKNFDQTKKFPRDRAISQSQTSLLRNYQSIPYKHFVDYKEKELADTVSLSLRNMSGEETIIEFEEKYLEASDKRIPVNFAVYKQFLGTSYAPEYYHYSFEKKSFNFDSDSLMIKSLVSVQSSDPDKRNGIDFTTNNIDSVFTLIDDYYAYDDGSAERTGGNIPGGPMLVKFKINKFPDTLTAIDINFAKAYTFNNPIYANLDIYIANKNRSVVQTIKGVKTTYPPGINNFTRIVPNNGYFEVTEDEFYIGYFNPYPVNGNFINIPIGMDYTNPQKQEVIYKNQGSGDWKQYLGGGNYMIRAVFGKLPVTGILDAEANVLACEVYPNPSTGVFTINGQVETATLFDIAGKQIVKKTWNAFEELKSLDVSHLKNGAYVLHLEKENQRSVKKIFIIRE